MLPGDTPAARDFAFGKELQDKLPRLFGSRIETIDQAKAAEAELLRLQPKSLKIGVPLNRLSEDVAHGEEHATIAQWLPEVPPLIQPADRDAWYAAEDRYLADPSPDQLHAMLDEHIRLVNTSRMLGLGVMSALKYRALLIWQDRIRNHSETEPVNVSRDVASKGNFNPFWDVGDIARDLMGRDPASLGMDEETQKKKVRSGAFSEELHELRVSWFLLGWLDDQGLFNTSHDDKVRFGLWMSQSFSEEGPYPIHNIYFNARRQAVVSNDLSAWGEPLVRKRRIWDMAGLRAFGYYIKDLPKEPVYRQMTVNFTANCFRMNLLLLKDEILRTRAVWVKKSAKGNVKEFVSFLKTQDPTDAGWADGLGQELFGLIDGARERNQFSPQ